MGRPPLVSSAARAHQQYDRRSSTSRCRRQSAALSLAARPRSRSVEHEVWNPAQHDLLTMLAAAQQNSAQFHAGAQHAERDAWHAP